MIREVLVDAFRCPEEFCSYTVASDLSNHPGYFLFGQETICYGRCSGNPSNAPIGLAYDAFNDIQMNGSVPTLPFDPNEVIENLRFERYAAKPRGPKEKLLYDTYYLVRPLLPVRLRKYIQRLRLNGSRTVPFPGWPVDSTVEGVLENLLTVALRCQGRTSMPFVWFWPHGLPSCAIITHDIETSAGLEFCSKLMDIDDSFGIKSSFQVVPEKRYSVSERMLASIRDRGFEVNIHDLNHDGHLYSERKEFLRRARKINEYARRYQALGFRSGALYRNLEWYDAFEFSYDMSVPMTGTFEAQGGGSCTIRPYFIYDLVELPLTTIQDYSLFHILGDYSIDIWKQQVDKIIERHGLISFIIHPDYVIEKKAQDTYRSLLEYLTQLRAEGKLGIECPGEVAKWWRERSQMTLAKNEEDKWHIAGLGHERARVARACLEGTRIKYSV
jgi:hypothetical protein